MLQTRQRVFRIVPKCLNVFRNVQVNRIVKDIRTEKFELCPLDIPNTSLLIPDFIFIWKYLVFIYSTLQLSIFKADFRNDIVH